MTHLQGEAADEAVATLVLASEELWERRPAEGQSSVSGLASAVILAAVRPCPPLQLSVLVCTAMVS